MSGFEDCRKWIPMLTDLGHGAPRRYVISPPVPRSTLTNPNRRYLRREESQGHCEMAGSPQEERRRMIEGNVRSAKWHFECVVSQERA